jgi:hypothetical protein
LFNFIIDHKVVAVAFSVLASILFIDLAFDSPKIENTYVSSLGAGKRGKSGDYCNVGLTGSSGEFFIEVDVLACAEFKGGQRVSLKRSVLFNRPSTAYIGVKKIDLSWNAMGSFVLFTCIGAIAIVVGASSGLPVTQRKRKLYDGEI